MSYAVFTGKLFSPYSDRYTDTLLIFRIIIVSNLGQSKCTSFDFVLHEVNKMIYSNGSAILSRTTVVVRPSCSRHVLVIKIILLLF